MKKNDARKEKEMIKIDKGTTKIQIIKAHEGNDKKEISSTMNQSHRIMKCREVKNYANY